VRVVEIGFRSTSFSPDNEPPAYEWNVQHRSGRFERKPEESLMLSGDQNMIELNATVHYRLSHPEDFLFRQLDGEATIRAAAESVMQSITTATSGGVIGGKGCCTTPQMRRFFHPERYRVVLLQARVTNTLVMIDGADHAVLDKTPDFVKSPFFHSWFLYLL